MSRQVTPFAQAYPAPWRLGDREVVDRDGCNVQDFDDDADTVEFWRGVVEAVNAQRNIAGSGEADAFRNGMTAGMAMSVAFMLRGGNETEAHEWWESCGLTMAELKAIGVDEYDLQPIRTAGLDRDDCYPYRAAECPGHVAGDHGPEVCGRCGTHIDELRPDDADPVNLAGSGPVPIEPRAWPDDPHDAAPTAHPHHGDGRVEQLTPWGKVPCEKREG